MCGVVGLVGRGVGSPERVVRAMAQAITRRGPDGDGFFVDASVSLGMRRLSVIDLTHGWQPLYSRHGRVIAFQNGEIYNHGQLRSALQREGYVFSTKCDTEVLAHGYDAWGMDGLLQRVDGMYAMVILDKDTRRLFLARDRFGEKPLFYCQQGDWFGYSSDLLTLAALPGIKADINPVALEYYLGIHFVPGDQTIFEGIYKVLPGEYLSISVDEPSRQERVRYFQQRLRRPKLVRTNRLASLVTKAVTSRLEADVPVGVFLSGGLDSSIVAAIAASASPGISTFSMGFHSEEHDESSYAREVAAIIGSNHHHFLFDCDRFVELLPKVASAVDEPIGDQATLPLYWLCQEATQHVTVALAGEGADEIFAGYGYYKDFSPDPGLKSFFRSLLRPGTARPSISRIICNEIPITPSGFPLLTDIAGREALIGQTNDRSPGAWEDQLMAWLESARDPLQRATAADLATWLPDDLLVKFDRMAMAHSLEGRAPFLMPELVDAAMHLPVTHRMVKGTSKVALRRIAGRWLPASISSRRKQGFVLPMRHWLQSWFQAYGGVPTYFGERELPCINVPEVVRLVNSDIAEGVRRERLLFALVFLFEWYSTASQSIARLQALYSRC